MTTAVILVLSIPVVYCLAFAVYRWFKRGSDRVDQLLHDEHRDESKHGAVASALAARNPAYRFRHYSDDGQLVTRVVIEPASALADESR